MTSQTYPFEVGDFQCFVIQDGASSSTAGDLVSNATQEDLERVAVDFNLDLERIPVGYNCLLVEGEGHKLLVDAGFRDGAKGGLRQGLLSLGIDPGEISGIIITHSDGDHIGGILEVGGVELTFPNAQVYLLDQAWKQWSTREARAHLKTLHHWPTDKIDFVWDTYSKIENRLNIVESGAEFIPGIALYPAVGHRYDHSVVRITSVGETLIHLADSLIHPLFMAGSEWYSTYDSDPGRAITTKAKMLQWCVSEKALVFASHFPFPGLGTIHKWDGIWEWKPVNLS